MILRFIVIGVGLLNCAEATVPVGNQTFSIADGVSTDGAKLLSNIQNGASLSQGVVRKHEMASGNIESIPEQLLDVSLPLSPNLVLDSKLRGNVGREDGPSVAGVLSVSQQRLDDDQSHAEEALFDLDNSNNASSQHGIRKKKVPDDNIDSLRKFADAKASPSPGAVQKRVMANGNIENIPEQLLDSSASPSSSIVRDLEMEKSVKSRDHPGQVWDIQKSGHERASEGIFGAMVEKINIDTKDNNILARAVARVASATAKPCQAQDCTSTSFEERFPLPVSKEQSGCPSGKKVMSRSHVSIDAPSAQLTLLSSESSSELRASNRYAQMLYGIVNSPYRIFDSGSKGTSDKPETANIMQEELRAASDLSVQVQHGMLAMQVRTLLSTHAMVLVVIVVLLLVLCCMPWRMKRKHEFEDLRIAAQHAFQHGLRFKESGDWRHTLNKLRELRRNTVNENHRVYSTIELHMDQPEIKGQLQNLFSELSEGEELLNVDKLDLMFANLYGEVTHLATGRTFMLSVGSYVWLLNAVKEPVPFHSFESIIALFLLVGCQENLMRGDSNHLDDNGDDVAASKITYFVEIRDRVVYRATFLYGDSNRELSAGSLANG